MLDVYAVWRKINLEKSYFLANFGYLAKTWTNKGFSLKAQSLLHKKP